MKKSKASVILVLFLVAMLAVGYFGVDIINSTIKGEGRNISLGLDLAGGASITYQVEEGTSQEDIDDTIYKLQKRLESLTESTEISVYQVGDDRIAVEIPGVTDANEILEELGEPGSLSIQDSDGNEVISGSDITSAQAKSTSDDYGNTEYVVAITLTDEAAETFATYTEEHVGDYLPIYYDGEMVSNPTIESAITDGSCIINGMSSYEEAEQLASYLRIGSLSVELTELQSNIVGAQLGEEAIESSVKAAGIGLIVIMIFMIFVYWVPGFAAALALILYTGMVICAMYLFDITLTLPGIAGVILSIGMAVDANVIIFARIREEIANEKTVKVAIETGFQKARSAILDGNITTFIAAVVLIIMGSGTVKGFAYTLAIGIVLSMFTALVITHLLVKALFTLGFKDEKFYGRKKKREPIQFLKRRVIFFAISIVLACSGFVAMGVYSSNGSNVLNFSLDFIGGTSTQATFDKEYTLSEIDSEIKPVVAEITGDNNIQVQKVADSTDIIIKTRELELEEREELAAALEENFGVDTSTISTQSISSTISSEMRTSTIQAILVAVICMLIYIWLRFRDFRFGTAAVAALVHDVLVVLAFYAIARVSVSTVFIACMLTIVGYSINATIVIFDRIRENNHGIRTADELQTVVDDSITQTLTRTIYTSFTTFVMTFCMYFVGVASIKEFALPLMVGIICGAYSSVCITGALWFVLKKRVGKNRITK
ncbi:MAG: protein translocase subunit SecD [Eubacterium sp.]|nr:protein translocase subunit SecD [Eubacterium sp.]